MIPSEFKFTVERIEKLAAPTHGELTFRDTEVRGLQIRLRSSGAATYEVRYRVGGGRAAPMRRHTIGSRQQISLATARRIAGDVLARARAGHDPAGERRAIAIKAKNEVRARAQNVVDGYIDHLRSDGVVAANQIASLLRRELLEPLGSERDLSTVSRAELMARVDAIATNGRKGLAPVFRTRVHGLLSWAVDRGLVAANVLAGARRRRGTRLQMLEAEIARTGRMLDMQEIAALWAATLDPRANRCFGAYVRVLLVTGARRTELAAARLVWISKGDVNKPTVLTLPPEITKNGRAHSIPLPTLALGIIAGVARHHSTDLLFPGGFSHQRGKIVSISGWSKLWPALLKIAREYGVDGPLTLHDLRKSARSHWSRIGIPIEVCEAMLNHRPRSRLVAIYDLGDRLDQRTKAMTRWCAALEQAVAARDGAKVGKGAEIVALLSSRRSASLKKQHPKRVIRQVSDA